MLTDIFPLQEELEKGTLEGESMCTEVDFEESGKCEADNRLFQMINIACQNVTEDTDSFDFCEVSLQSYPRICLLVCPYMSNENTAV